MSDTYFSFPFGVQDISDRAAWLRERQRGLDAMPSAAYGDAIKQMAELYAGFAGALELLVQHLPFQVGDRVRLVDPPVCDGGWQVAKHWMVAGAEGVVSLIQPHYLMKRVDFYVTFDDESTIVGWPPKDQGKIRPVAPKDRHVWPIAPHRLHLVSSGKKKHGAGCDCSVCTAVDQ